MGVWKAGCPLSRLRLLAPVGSGFPGRSIRRGGGSTEGFFAEVAQGGGVAEAISDLMEGACAGFSFLSEAVAELVEGFVHELPGAEDDAVGEVAESQSQQLGGFQASSFVQCFQNLRSREGGFARPAGISGVDHHRGPIFAGCGRPVPGFTERGDLFTDGAVAGHGLGVSAKPIVFRVCDEAGAHGVEVDIHGYGAQ